MDILTAAEHKGALRKVLYIMRHGRTVLDDEGRSDGWLDYPLSDDGRIGLMPAQQFLKAVPLKKVVTSSLRRCEETAHIIQSGVLSRPPMAIDEKTRTWNLGHLIGTKKKPNKPVVKFFMDNPDKKPTAGESMNQFRKRFLSSVKRCLSEARSGKGPILLVVSGSGIREISRMLAGDTDRFDLDESGLMMIVPFRDKLHGKVIFGHKSEKGEWMS